MTRLLRIMVAQVAVLGSILALSDVAPAQDFVWDRGPTMVVSRSHASIGPVNNGIAPGYFQRPGSSVNQAFDVDLGATLIGPSASSSVIVGDADSSITVIGSIGPNPDLQKTWNLAGIAQFLCNAQPPAGSPLKVLAGANRWRSATDPLVFTQGIWQLTSPAGRTLADVDGFFEYTWTSAGPGTFDWHNANFQVEVAGTGAPILTVQTFGMGGQMVINYWTNFPGMPVAMPVTDVVNLNANSGIAYAAVTVPGGLPVGAALQLAPLPGVPGGIQLPSIEHQMYPTPGQTNIGAAMMTFNLSFDAN